MSNRSMIYRVTACAIIPAIAAVIWSGCADAGAAESARRINDQAGQVYEAIVELRRDIHQHPELSGSEERTAGVVAEALRSYGLEVRIGVGGHGVVGVLRGGQDGPVVAYRADMDALPQEIDEQVPFRSGNPGISHACGHDIHTAVGLGVARVLSNLRQDLRGTAVFLFQPAEEIVEGARRMIEEGALTDPVPQAIFALHVTPLEIGSIATTPGVGLPGMDYGRLTLEGGDSLDTLTTALMDSLQGLATVHVPTSEEEWLGAMNAVLVEGGDYSPFTLCLVRAGQDSPPSTREVRVYIKASGEEQYLQGRDEVNRLASALEDQGVSVETVWNKVLPDMISDRELAQWALKPLKSILGEGLVPVTYHSIPFFGEDFAYYLQQIPGVMFWLGGSNTDEGIIALPHSPTFALDEKAILTGIKGMSAVMISYLKQH